MAETRVYRCRDCGLERPSGEWPVHPRQGTAYCPRCLTIPDLVHGAPKPAQGTLFGLPEPTGPCGRGGGP